MMLSRRHILGNFKSILLKLLITLLNSVQSRSFIAASNQQVYDIRNSGFLYKKSLVDFGRAYDEWALSDKEWRAGEYAKSTKRRKSVLELIYYMQEVRSENYSPPVMSAAWASAFGHIGSLGIYRMAQKLGIVSDSTKTVLLQNKQFLQPLRVSMRSDFHLVPFKYGYSSLDHPSQWHLAERLQMVKVQGDFICLYELHHRVFSHPEFESFTVQIDTQYSEWARQELTRIGLPPDAWFVALHIRDNFHKFDSRMATASNFEAAIDEIIGRHGWVIQFGLNTSRRVKPRKGFINLNENTEHHLKLHHYLLSKCKFLLTTNSGPAVVAWSFGTPVLQANTTSIGRNILKASKNSLYLPKHYYDQKGNQLSFSRIISGTLGYSETSTKELAKLGISIRENSAREILDATRDMFMALENRASNLSLDKTLNEIRKNANAVGYGDISPSFLAEHGSWVLL